MLKSNVYKATKWAAITNILRKMITPIINMILARLLTPEIFGVVATISVVISFADMFTDAGFQKYLVQHNFNSEDDLNNATNVAFWTNFVLSLIIWGIIFCFRDQIAYFVGSKGYGWHVFIAALSIPLLSFSSIQQAVFKRNFDFKSLFIPRIINALIPLIVTVPIAYIYRNAWSLIIGTLVSNASDAVLLTIKSTWKPKLYYNFKILKEMFSFSMWTLFETLAIWLTVNVDIFILGRILTMHEIGIYKTSLTTINQITNLITTTIIPVLFSALSRNQNNDIEFKNTFYEFFEDTSILLFPLSIGIFVYKDFVTNILLGSKWVEAADFIGLLGLMQAITVVISNFSSEVYRAKGNPKISFLTQILYILVLIPIVYYFGKHNFKYLCIFRSLSLIIFAMIHLINLKFVYKFSILTITNKMKYPLIFSIIMGLFGYIFKLYLKGSLHDILGVAICIAIYFLCCLSNNKTKKVIINLKKYCK